VAALGALVFTGQSLRSTRDQISLTEQGQLTERFSRAVEQVGSRSSLDVRLGGIYSLERLARDSPRDHPTVVEVLAAFLREHAPAAECPADRPPPTDILAAASVLGRRVTAQDPTDRSLDLHGTCLAGADFSETDLSFADLRGAVLRDADLYATDLAHARLEGANLVGADLYRANMTCSDLTRARLRNTALARVDFTGAKLVKADLAGAHFSGVRHNEPPGTIHANPASASLENADLTGADLTGADFTAANITGARFTDAILTDVHGLGTLPSPTPNPPC